MPSVSGYILTIAGVILISVIVEFAMSEGQMNRYIRSVFSFFIIAVIIAPLPALISSEGFTSIFDYEDFELQKDYLEALDKSKEKTLSYELQSIFAEEGYKKLIIEVDIQDGAISQIIINISQLEISKDAKYQSLSDISNHITASIIEKCKINKEKIIYED